MGARVSRDLKPITAKLIEEFRRWPNGLVRNVWFSSARKALGVQLSRANFFDVYGFVIWNPSGTVRSAQPSPYQLPLWIYDYFVESKPLLDRARIVADRKAEQKAAEERRKHRMDSAAISPPSSPKGKAARIRAQRRAKSQQARQRKVQDDIDAMKVSLLHLHVALSMFCNGKIHQRTVLAFLVADVDDSGEVDKEEMVVFIKIVCEVLVILQLCRSLPPEEEMRAVVERLFLEADINGDGVLSPDEFLEWAGSANVTKKLVKMFENSDDLLQVAMEAQKAKRQREIERAKREKLVTWKASSDVAKHDAAWSIGFVNPGNKKPQKAYWRPEGAPAPDPPIDGWADTVDSLHRSRRELRATKLGLDEEEKAASEREKSSTSLRRTVSQPARLVHAASAWAKHGGSSTAAGNEHQRNQRDNKSSSNQLRVLPGIKKLSTGGLRKIDLRIIYDKRSRVSNKASASSKSFFVDDVQGVQNVLGRARHAARRPNSSPHGLDPSSNDTQTPSASTIHESLIDDPAKQHEGELHAAGDGGSAPSHYRPNFLFGSSSSTAVAGGAEMDRDIEVDPGTTNATLPGSSGKLESDNTAGASEMNPRSNGPSKRALRLAARESTDSVLADLHDDDVVVAGAGGRASGTQTASDLRSPIVLTANPRPISEARMRKHRPQSARNIAEQAVVASSERVVIPRTAEWDSDATVPHSEVAAVGAGSVGKTSGARPDPASAKYAVCSDAATGGIEPQRHRDLLPHHVDVALSFLCDKPSEASSESIGSQLLPSFAVYKRGASMGTEQTTRVDLAIDQAGGSAVSDGGFFSGQSESFPTGPRVWTSLEHFPPGVDSLRVTQSSRAVQFVALASLPTGPRTTRIEHQARRLGASISGAGEYAKPANDQSLFSSTVAGHLETASIQRASHDVGMEGDDFVLANRDEGSAGAAGAAVATPPRPRRQSRAPHARTVSKRLDRGVGDVIQGGGRAPGVGRRRAATKDGPTYRFSSRSKDAFGQRHHVGKGVYEPRWRGHGGSGGAFGVRPMSRQRAPSSLWTNAKMNDPESPFKHVGEALQSKGLGVEVGYQASQNKTPLVVPSGVVPSPLLTTSYQRWEEHEVANGSKGGGDAASKGATRKQQEGPSIVSANVVDLPLGGTGGFPHSITASPSSLIDRAYQTYGDYSAGDA